MAHIPFGDDDSRDAKAQSPSRVAKAEVSPSAKLKASTKWNGERLPVHSPATLLDDLSILTPNTVKVAGKRDIAFEAAAKPTRVQNRVPELLDIDTTVVGDVARSM